MFGFTDYFWRLLPANPILLRVVSTAGKRKRDLITRCLYLGLLIAVAIWSFATSGGTGSSLSLDALTATSESIFHDMSFLQLGLVALLAPIFTAGAITQEKDSQTYDILLATPLTNGQIVLGSLMSRMFFIFALLLSGIPIFSITQIFGGVAIGSIVISVLIAAATALVTGALATAIATFKVGTRRTIFSFYMLVAIYLVGLFLCDRLDAFHVGLVDPSGNPNGQLSQTSWLTGIHPFLALSTLFPGYRPPDITQLPERLRGWPFAWYFTSPQTFYPAFMFALSALLVLPSIGLLRKMAQTTTTIQSKLFKLIPMPAGVRVRKPRGVWNNPIAWREAKTKASAARASMLRYGFITIGLLGAITILYLYASEGRTPKNWITPAAYTPSSQTLLMRGQGDNNVNYAVSPTTAFRVGGREVDLTDLGGRYEVVAFNALTIAGRKTLQSVDLAPIEGRISREQAHQFLLGAILVEVAVILLIVTNAAASTVTREREDGTLDLLLSTPITSRYYIWGKLSGLVSFMLPLVAVPVVSALLFVGYDTFRWITGDRGVQWLVLPEAVPVMPVTLIIVVAFATIVGMQMSLRNKTTVRAVMSSIGLVVGAIALLGWCGNTMVTQNNGQFGSLVASFSPVSVVMLMVWPEQYGGSAFTSKDPNEIFAARVGVIVVSLIAATAYAAVVYAMYKSMVKNFDMTIRKQSGR